MLRKHASGENERLVEATELTLNDTQRSHEDFRFFKQLCNSTTKRTLMSLFITVQSEESDNIYDCVENRKEFYYGVHAEKRF